MGRDEKEQGETKRDDEEPGAGKERRVEMRRDVTGTGKVEEGRGGRGMTGMKEQRRKVRRNEDWR